MKGSDFVKHNDKDIKDLIQFITENSDEDIAPDEQDALAQRYLIERNGVGIPKDTSPDADDYLEMASNAGSKKKQPEYIQKALSLEPDNADAKQMRLKNISKNPFELYVDYCNNRYHFFLNGYGGYDTFRNRVMQVTNKNNILKTPILYLSSFEFLKEHKTEFVSKIWTPHGYIYLVTLDGWVDTDEECQILALEFIKYIEGGVTYE